MAELEICRICLRMDTKMYNLNLCKIKSFYEEIVSYQINQEKILPNYICYECVALLNKFYNFREKCYHGLNILIRITSKGPLTHDKVQKIDRIKENLQTPFQIYKESFTYPQDDKEDNAKEDVKLEISPVKVEKEENYINNDHVYSDEIFNDDFCESEIIKNDDVDSDEIFNYELCEIENIKTKKEEGKHLSLSVQKKKKRKKKPKVSKRCLKKDLRDILDENYWKIKFLTEEEAVKEFKARAVTGYYTRADFKCTDCLKGFSKEEMLIRHKTRMHREGESLKECDLCRTRFKYSAGLRKHVLGHFSRFQCLRCKNQPVFCLESSATLHDDTHSDVTKKCPHCDKEFKHSSTLYTHVRTHRSRHVCRRCGGAFVSAAGLRQHHAHKHAPHTESTEDEDDEGLHCAVCEVTFASREAYKEHFFQSELHTVDNIEEQLDISKKQKIFDKSRREFISEKLGLRQEEENKSISRKKPLKRNSKRPPRKPTTCRHCGEHFDGLVKCMNHHRKVHTGLPFYPESERHICEICGAVLAPGSVLAHLNNHSRARLHACSSCGRQFTQSSTLKRHMLTHTGEKPWPCDICGKSFTQSGSRKLHYKTVHLKEPHPKRNRSNKKLPSQEKFEQLLKDT